MWFRKVSARRQAIREDVAEMQAQGRSSRARAWHLVLITVVFALAAAGLQWKPEYPLPYRVGQVAPVELRSPVTFKFEDPVDLERKREAARVASPPVLLKEDEALGRIQAQLGALRQEVQGKQSITDLKPELREHFPGLTDKALADMQSLDQASFAVAVETFKAGLSRVPLVSQADREALVERHATTVALAEGRTVEANPPEVDMSKVFVIGEKGVSEEGRKEVMKAAAVSQGGAFSQPLADFVTSFVMSMTQPTFRVDSKLTASLAELLVAKVQPQETQIWQNEPIVLRGKVISADQYQKLAAAQVEFERVIARENPWARWWSRLGGVLTVAVLTIAGAVYISRTQPTITLRRGWVVCGLLLATLVMARGVVGYAPESIYLAGVGPTMLAAIILVVAYNERLALGMAALHGLLVTFTLGQGIDFYLVLMAGAAVFCFGLNEIRTRGKLIEVGAAASLAIFATIWALGFTRMSGLVWSARAGAADFASIWTESLWGTGAGVSVAMFALAILPSVERLFRITTAMTLLELCDASKPLLRRLSVEAPGTFNHSLTVGIMAEAAGNAVGANGLLCRVGAYYHDVGKLSKPQYFAENQVAGAPSRHDKLSPAMSLLIIVGHVKDGIELAREYGLPWVVHEFIAQHHGTTLVEYFYHAARKRAEKNEAGPRVSETEFRYPGPKPQTPEAAIVMICDSCESLVRAIEEPTQGRIESAVHNMIMKRLMDGQCNECDLTLRDLTVIEETLVRTLAGIHHGRVAYPARRENEAGSDVGLSRPA